jgi:TolB-like protein
MAELRRLLPLFGDDHVAEVRRVLRLAVLPFRLLKPDPEIDYLPASVADVLASSLSGMESLVVRSNLASARYANMRPDLDVLASELAADVVLTGSILRVKDRLRVSVELVSVPAGDVLLADTMQVPVDDVFELVEALASRVVASLPLTDQDQSRRPGSRSASTKAFDLYLHGMQLRMETSSWKQARAFFQQSVDIDRSFAPAWAERGRLDRVLGKYEDPDQLARAESALMHALELDPDNAPAQYYFAQLEIDLGRVDAALARLLRRVRERRVEPQIHAALVHACRYGGLLEASVAAHRRAQRLDPQVSTGILHTYYMQGAFELAAEEAHRSSDPVESRALAALGRDREAIETARREEERFAAMPLLRSFSSALRAALEHREDEALQALQAFDAFGFNDGEGLFYVAEIYARLGLIDRAMATLDRSIGEGFLCVPAYENNPVLARVREHDRWGALIDRARTRQRPIVETFARAGGPTLLGLKSA